MISDIEAVSGTSHLASPIVKRKYVRKPKVLVDMPVELSQVGDVSSLPTELPAELPQEKPSRQMAPQAPLTSPTGVKRKYVKKSKSPVESPVDLPIEPPVEPVIESPVDQPVAKKPRSDKQIAAFNRMREARLKKQAELDHLKEVAKHQAELEKEQIAIEKIEAKIIKKKAARTASDTGLVKRKPRAKSPPVGYGPHSGPSGSAAYDADTDTYEPAPQPAIKVSTSKPILFV